MRKFASLGAVTLIASVRAMPVVVQTSVGTSQTHAAYMTGDRMRTSKLDGMSVYNDHGQEIGTSDEILIDPTGLRLPTLTRRLTA